MGTVTEPRPVVLVLMGGPDAEREVSLMSGRAVAQALRSAGRYEVAEAVIARPELPDLAAMAADVVFPALHGQFGEGGPLQDTLEALGVPYVGCGPRAARLAMDKHATKRVVSAAGVPTPDDLILEPGAPCRMAPPLVLKPLDDGSSVDVFICRTPGEVAAARPGLHERRGRIMAERYLAGREVTAGILCGEVLPLVEIIPGAGAAFYDYQAKYFRDDTRYVVDPALPGGAAGACRSAALRAFRRLGCRDLARVDFIVDDRGPWFLEVNTMPGFTAHSLLPMAAKAAGTDMPELCARLVDAALARGRAAVAGSR
jgi:D-alanine-D-alanine ligase